MYPPICEVCYNFQVYCTYEQQYPYIMFHNNTSNQNDLLSALRTHLFTAVGQELSQLDTSLL